ncbi:MULTISPECIES: flavodoxin family protein [unclassified Clostridium]|uniref:flavodoxin family protein n=1 Tax=unclassified Clostridium TaxID=2614128 RepID=UPI000297A480|nr:MULTISPECIES: flavodoxin family protein [unclassified Clostridium]EKQ56817.1 MAG: multimeric flavodoxin WrbA [Clostridium sp. Maddingley MBC34-26]
MKVIAINGSARKNGNTSMIIEAIFSELKKCGIETELIDLANEKISGCTGCGACFKNKDNKCVFKNDIVNECIEKMIEADGIILGSPVYFADVTANMKALLERIGMVSSANGAILSKKVGASVVAVRRGAATRAFDTMNYFLHYMQMYLVGGTYWNMVYGKEVGEVLNDIEGMKNMESIGKNMAWLLNKIN